MAHCTIGRTGTIPDVNQHGLGGDGVHGLII